MNATPLEEADVAIVGGGIAGLVTAVRASEMGLRVVVLEKGEGTYLCNSRFTGGAFHVCFHNVEEPPEALAQAIREGTDGTADPGVVSTLAEGAAAAVGWLRRQGIRTIKAGPEAWRQNFLSPPGLMSPGLHWQGRGGDVLLRTLGARLESLGGRIRRGVRARRIALDGTRLAGVHVDHGGMSRLVRASHVVLCDGGFQANLGLLREFVSPAPEKLKQRGAATGQGDALMMAREVGAALAGMSNVYGHVLSRQALTDDGLWPYPILDFVCGAGIVVDPSGRRFMDEGMGGVFMTNQIARLADPLSATVIFDRAIWEGPATEFILPTNPHFPLAGGQVVTANSLEELAAKIQVSASGLVETVSQYNAAVHAGAAGSLTPARTATKSRPWPISVPPFCAVPLAAGVTYTMGGIATDGSGRVVRDAGGVVENLYAAGCSAGGLEGGPNSGYVGGLIKSAVMGRRVAETMVADRSTSNAANAALRAQARTP